MVNAALKRRLAGLTERGDKAGQGELPRIVADGEEFGAEAERLRALGHEVTTWAGFVDSCVASEQPAAPDEP